MNIKIFFCLKWILLIFVGIFLIMNNELLLGLLILLFVLVCIILSRLNDIDIRLKELELKG